MKKIVFVIGSGRNGTHLLGRILGSHPDAKLFLEDPIFFDLSKKIATKRRINPFLLRRLIAKYKKALDQLEKKILVEKSHTNIWIAEKLNEKFRGISYFVGIKRDVFSTVSSMLNHDGVMHWYDILDQSKPNSFLGITDQNKSYFANLPLESRCTLRWLSHVRKLESLKEKLKNNYLLIEYEELINDLPGQINILSEFLDVENLFFPEDLQKSSLYKWKNHLTSSQIKNIQDTLNREST